MSTEGQSADVNQVEATSKVGFYMIATACGLFLVEIELTRLDIKILKSFLQSASI